MDRMTYRCGPNDCHVSVFREYEHQQAFQKLADYEDAEQDGKLVSVCFCKNCKYGFLDKEMSSPEKGWLYGCKYNRNSWRKENGFCSSGEPKTAT